MTTPIGYATLQFIPSLDGVSDSINKQLKGMPGLGKNAGKLLGSGIASGMKASESDVKRAMDGYSKLYDKQKDAAGKLRTELDKLKDLQERGVTGGRLTAQAERAEKARRDEARAVREARDAYKEYERAAESASGAGKDVGGGLLDKLKGLAGSAKSSGGEAASGFVEGFGGPIAELGTKAGPIGLALAAAAALAVGAGAIIGRQVMAGIEQEQQQADVAARLGLSPQQMKPIADAAAAAYAANFGESVAANMDAARAAIQSGLLNPDATAADTQKMVEQLTTVSNVMGEEIPATARAAQQAIRTGLASNATQAFDLFVKAQQSGLNVSEDFLDTITEYGTQFRKLGLSGPEAIGLINQAVKGGARDTDVAADAIKEFSIRAVDGSKTTVDGFTQIGLNADEMAAKFAAGGQSAHDAFAQTLTAVRGIKDPVEQSRVAVELFGTQAEDLGGALNALDLSNAVSQLGAVDGAAQHASDTMGNTTAGSIEAAKRSIETASNSMQQSLADAFGPTLKQGADFLVSHQDDITHAFSFMAGAATEFGGAVAGVGGSIVLATGVIIGAIGDTAGFVLDGFEQMAKGAAVVARAVGAEGLATDLDHASAQLGVFSDQFHGWGKGMTDAGGKIINFGIDLHNLDTSFGATQQSAQNAAAQIQHVKETVGALPGGKQINIDAIVTFKDPSGLVISPDQLKTPTYTPATPGESNSRRAGGRASGGPIFGPGGPRADKVPIWASNGEHMWTAAEVDAVGGQANMYRLRALALKGAFRRGFAGGGDIWALANVTNDGDPFGGGGQKTRRRIIWWGGPDDPPIGHTPDMPQDILPIPGKPGQDPPNIFGGSPGEWPPNQDFPKPGDPRWIWRHNRRGIGGLGASLGYKDGGAIGPDVRVAGDLVGTPYDKGSRHDCSGMVARVIDGTLGIPDTNLMTTKNASEWLAARGFVPGIGGKGQISVGWYDHGPNPNDGHMAMTLSDGSHAEAGGGVGDIFQIGGGAAGADDRQFDQHMHLPTVYGEGPAGGGSASPFAGGSATAAMTGGGSSAAASSSGGGTSSGGGGGGGGGSFSLSGFPSSLAGFGSFAGGQLGDLAKLGSAAGSFIDGQVASVLDVFGVPDSPGWLKGISQLIGGISIGGGGGSAAPFAAGPAGTGTPPPDDAGNMHGARAGQAPGPTYNITARDTEDAFVKAQRVEREKAAAKLSRY